MVGIFTNMAMFVLPVAEIRPVATSTLSKLKRVSTPKIRKIAKSDKLVKSSVTKLTVSKLSDAIKGEEGVPAV